MLNRLFRMLNRLFRRENHVTVPEPLSQEVLVRIASQYPEPDRAEVIQALLRYQQAPINFGRMRILDAANGHAADLPHLVHYGNRYGQDWTMYDGLGMTD